MAELFSIPRKTLVIIQVAWRELGMDYDFVVDGSIRSFRFRFLLLIMAYRVLFLQDISSKRSDSP